MIPQCPLLGRHGMLPQQRVRVRSRVVVTPVLQTSMLITLNLIKRGARKLLVQTANLT
jgi:hypothetical protein